MAYLSFSKKAKLHGSVVKGFPLIFTDKHRLHVLTLNYFLEKFQGIALSSLNTYARHLVDFIDQLESENEGKDTGCLLDLSCVDDDYLSAYKQSIVNRNGNKENYASQVLSTVINYLYWLESNEYFRNLIGTTLIHKVRIEFTPKGRIKHPLIKQTDSDDRAKPIAPRSDWIDVIKQYGPKEEIANTVFELMVDYGKLGALRAKEICNLKISNLPLKETVEKAIENQQQIYLKLTVTKGSKEGNVPFSNELLLWTWKYIEFYRDERLKVAKKIAKNKHEPFKDEGFVFLNSRGNKFSERGFSNSIRKKFIKAVENSDLTEDERVWLHGLRHHALTIMFKKLDEAGVKRPESIVQTISRHKNIDTLDVYTVARHDKSFK